MRPRQAASGLVAALLIAAILAACGDASSKQFSSPRVPFTFDYPTTLKRCGAFGSSIAVLGWCASQPTFGITATDYVGVGRYTGGAASLVQLRKALDKLVPSGWSSVRIERHSGMTMVVARGQRKAGYPYSAYFFPLRGKLWRIDCASSPSHLRDSLAACRQAIESVKPNPS